MNRIQDGEWELEMAGSEEIVDEVNHSNPLARLFSDRLIMIVDKRDETNMH